MAIGKIFFQKLSLHIEINVRYVLWNPSYMCNFSHKEAFAQTILNVIQYFSCNVT